MARIAATIEALDADFISAALGRPGELRSVKSTRIGSGQVALSVRLELDWDVNEGPRALVAKIPASVTESRNAARLMRLYHVEVGFYRDISPQVMVPHPSALYAEIDEESGDFTLLMSESPGVVGDQLVGCTPEQSVAMVDAIVGLHGPTWGRSDELVTLRWLRKFDTTTVKRRIDTYRALLPAFEQRFSERLNSEVFDSARWLGRHFESVLMAYRSAPCLTHGDFRLDNVLFDSSGQGTAVTVLDWQTVALGRGAADVAYGIGSGLLQDARRRHEQDLIHRYIEQLWSNGVTVTAADVENDYRVGTVGGLSMAVIASQIVTATDRGDEMFAVMAERHVSQMSDNDVFALV